MQTGYNDDRRQRMMREAVQARWTSAQAPVRHLDPVLMITALALTSIGLVAIYSAKLTALTSQGRSPTEFVSRQLIALAIGIVAMVLLAIVDHHHARVHAPALYGLSLVLLVLTLTPLGTEINGSRRWIVLGGFQLQPSELAKLALLVALASLLHGVKGTPSGGHVLAAMMVALAPIALVFVQPDLGTSIVFVWLTAVLLLVGGVRVRYLIGLTAAAFAAVAVALQTEMIRSYQLSRLIAFLDAGDAGAAQTSAFQTRQSLIAIGSGRFTGKGLFQGTQTALSYVPENHTDFIFTVIGEEFGFLGSSVVLGLYLVLVWRGLRIATLAKDGFGCYLAAGIVAILALQVFVNVGMAVGIMPVTGLPLPFVSYGGTSLIVWFGMVGLLLNVHMRRF